MRTRRAMPIGHLVSLALALTTLACRRQPAPPPGPPVRMSPGRFIQSGPQEFTVDLELYDANQQSVASEGTLEFAFIEGVSENGTTRTHTLCRSSTAIRRDAFVWRADLRWHVLTLHGRFDAPCEPIRQGRDLRPELTFVTPDARRLLGIAGIPESMGQEARTRAAATETQAAAREREAVSARARVQIAAQLPLLANVFRAVPEPSTMSERAPCPAELRSRTSATIDHALLAALSNAGPTGDRIPQPTGDEAAFGWISDDAFRHLAIGLRDGLDPMSAPPETDLLQVIRAERRAMPVVHGQSTGERPGFDGGTFDGVMFIVDRHDARVLCHARFHAESSTEVRTGRNRPPYQVVERDFRDRFGVAIAAAFRSIVPETDAGDGPTP